MRMLRTLLGRRARWAIAGWLIAGTAAAAQIPPALESWRDWVLHGQDAALCVPFGDTTQCAWPGELALDVDDTGLRFAQTWILQAPQRVPLPGSDVLRPIDVRADGEALPVLPSGTAPLVQLGAGTHRIEGRIAWSRRPSTLPVPPAVALLALRVDGAVVASPERDDEDALVLGAAGGGESDALQVEIYRLLADGVPQMLATRVDLSVSGKPREQVLGRLLPDGFVPVQLDGDLPARLDASGGLRVQLRAGSWSLLLAARAVAPMDAFRLPAGDAGADLLPAQEIWQFRGDPQFRLAQLSGVPGIDPNQTGVPDWEDMADTPAPPFDRLFAQGTNLPAYLLDRDSVATLDVKLRGLPATRPPRLTLQRELWLSFDGDGYLAQDNISGELGSAQRLDMRAPWSLERAAREEPLLVTRGGEPGLSGVELRDSAVKLDTGARAPRDRTLPANGWTEPFDAASAVLHLPPGYRLLGATGADRAIGSWWDAWSLLDIFLLSLFALMAWRLGGIALGGALVAWVLLAWHEPLAPRVSLLSALALTLLVRHLPQGRLARIAGWLRNALLVLAALLVLPFAATQLRMALHPQLERDSAARGYNAYDNSFAGGVVAEVSMAPPPPAPPPPPAQKMQAKSDENATLDRIEVTGSRIKRVDLFSYPADTITQAGSARPGWEWHHHALQWNGPLATDTPLGLVISPPWLTRAWRIVAVLLLALVVWQLARLRATPPAARPRLTPRSAQALVLVALGLGALPGGDARAQATAAPIPGPELLAELRQRLVARDEPCRPACAALGTVIATANADRLVLQLDAQAQARTAWPLPRPDAALHLEGVRVDGVDAAVVRDAAGAWVALERGVHRVEVAYVASGERWRIAFPLAPATLDLRAEGFEIAGVDDGRLIGDTLDLVPPRTVQADAGEEHAAPQESVPPFVQVVRNITFDQQWMTDTFVKRVAPQRSGLTVAIALLPGEQIFFSDPAGIMPAVRNGQAIVSLPAGTDSLRWQSRLVPGEKYTLTAGDGRTYGEEWRLAVAPLLHAQTDGIPEAGQDHHDGNRRFLPLPGETLTVTLSRPAAVDGASVAIEGVSLHVEPGQQARSSTLRFSLRATRAGEHALQLPAEAELLGFSIDGVAQPLLLDEGRLSLPLRTAPQAIELRWRDAIDIASVLRTPDVSLAASAANIDLDLQVPQDRWLLFTYGPAVGPAVLFWSGLAAMLLAAVALARLGGTPLRLHDWLLLGLGFSALSWWPAALVAGWLLAIGWRARHPELIEHRASMLLQIGLVLVTLAALLCLLLAIPYGLLSQPDMHVAGNQSWGGNLRWFADRSADGTLPVAGAVTLPLWCYKLAILLWSLWLASALLRWLRWTWASLNGGGFWPKPKPKARVVEPEAPADNTAKGE